MSDCMADVKILPNGQNVTIGDGMAMSLPYSFTAKATGDPCPVDADTVTATVGDLSLTVTQTDASTFTVSATAETLAPLKAALPWRVDVPGLVRFAGTFRRTSTAGCSTDAQTITVTTGDTVVAVTVDGDAALAAQVAQLTAENAALTARLDALEAVAVVHTPTI